MRGRVTAYVGAGSNLGDRAAFLREGLRRLHGRPGVKITAVSPLYETPPWGAPGPPYLNLVCRVATALGPAALLAELLTVEAELGRERRWRWAPRTLDLDLLLYDDLTRRDAPPLVPHPRLHERVFVLRPLADLAPALAVPGLGRTVAELLAALPPPVRAGAVPVRVEVGPWK